jgi:Protein of unknown function (DUF3263)
MLDFMHGEVSAIQTFAGLSELEVKILEFENSWWRYAGAKEASIKEIFGFNPTAYYQALNNLIDRPEALSAAPVLVRRLIRQREARLERK